MNIPKTIDELTPQWLTQALRASDAIADEIVTQIEFESPTDEYGRQKGNLSNSYQLHVQYDSEVLDVPQTFFVKLSTPTDPPNWLTVYRREVNFYQNYAQESGVRTPKCYYSDIDLETGYHILMLEDMSDARCGSLTQGYTVQEAEEAILAIAKFQARWWGSPQLKDLVWDGDPDEVYTAVDFQADWETITEKIQCPVPDAIRAINQKIGTYIEIMYAHQDASPQTLVHSDFHLENLLFPTDGSPMAIIDWQALVCGIGVYDVVYNMLTSLNTKDRRQHEKRLLRLYHDTLIDNGVTNYSFDTCYEDYVIGFFRMMHIFILIFLLDLFDSEEERMRFRDAILPNLEAFLSDHLVEKILDNYLSLIDAA